MADKKFNPTAEATFTITCCKFSVSARYKYDCANKFLSHVKRHHPNEFKKLYVQARKLARGQNGCGYFDAGEDGPTSGWAKAGREFREAWVRQALMDKFAAGQSPWGG
jgi:hypothetical protein